LDFAVPPPKELETHYAFLDTQAYFEHRFDWSGRILGKLAQFGREGDLKLLTTDVTKREVRAQLAELVSDINDRLQKSRPILEQLGLGHSISDISVATSTLFEKFEQFLERSGTTTIPTSNDATSILDDYFERRPPFGHGKKKTEFPDAFVIAALMKWSSDSNRSVYVVSRDSDLGSCCSPTGPLLHLESVQELLSFAVVRAEIRSKIIAAVQNSAELKNRVKRVFEGLKLASPSDGVTLEDVSVDDPIIHNVNVVDKDGDTFLLEIEVEVPIYGNVRRERLDSLAAFNGLDYRPQFEIEYFDTAQFFYPEVEVVFTPDDPQTISIESVYFSTEEFDVDLSGSSHSFGRRSGSVKFRFRHQLW
jgi:hypothetical protein